MTNAHDDTGGHYVTAGQAAVGMGLFGLVANVAATGVLKLSFGFITPAAAAVISLLTLVVGASMIRTGRSLQRPT